MRPATFCKATGPALTGGKTGEELKAEGK